MSDRNWRGDSGSSSVSSPSSSSGSHREEKFDGNRTVITNASPSFVAWQEHLKKEEAKRQQFVQEWYEKRGLTAPQADAPTSSQDSPKI